MISIRNCLNGLAALLFASVTAQAAEDTFSLRTIEIGTLGSYQDFVIQAPEGTVVEVSNPFDATIVSPYLHGLHFPTSLELKNRTIKENFPVGTVIGQFKTLDPDLQETFTYSLSAGEGAADNAKFAIVEDRLVSNSIFYHEVKAEYSVRIATTDSTGLSIERVFAVGVLPVLPVEERIFFNPDFFSANPAVDLAEGTLTVDSDSLKITGAINATGTLMPTDAEEYVAVFSFEDLNLGTAVTVNFTGKYPVAFLSKADIRIDGKLVMTAADGDMKTSPGGGLDGGAAALGGAAGGYGGAIGKPGDGLGGGKVSGGGASHATSGANGNNNGSLTGDPGVAVYNLSDSNIDMIGGSGGAGGQGRYRVGSGGAGGGALQLRSVGAVVLGQKALISMDGGRGGNATAGGGGGSGGTLIVKAMSVTHAGTISAKGGDGGFEEGGSGGGGAGGVVMFNAEELDNQGTIGLAGGANGFIDDDHPAAAGGLFLEINASIPIIDWAKPEAITYGTAISVAQLNPSTDVAGAFVFEPKAGTILGAGQHTLKATFTPDDADSWFPATLEVPLEVRLAKLTIKAESVERVFGEENPNFVLSIDGFVNGEGPADLTGTVVATTAATKNSILGTYAITTSGVSSENYDIEFLTGESGGVLTIAKGHVLLSWAKPEAITYGTAISIAQLNPSTDVAGSFAFETKARTILGAGQHTLKATFTPDNLDSWFPATLEVPLEVRLAKLTIKAESVERVFGEENPNFVLSIDGFVNGEGPADLTGTLVGTTLATKNSIPGMYTITTSGVSSGNYDIEFLTGEAGGVLTITKGHALLSWVKPAVIVYGEQLSGAELNAVAKTEAGGRLEGTFVYEPKAGTLLGAGSHTLKATFVPASQAGYSGSQAEVVLTVQKAPLLITADDVQKRYGEDNPDLSVSYSGFIVGEGPDALSQKPTITTVADKSSSVGDYAITAWPMAAANYAINYKVGVLTVTQAAPVISWSTPENIVYGTVLSASELSAVASTQGELVYEPDVGTLLDAGDHGLSVSFTPSDAVNFEGATSSRTVSVQKAPLSIKVKDAVRAFSKPNPSFEIVYEGFVSGEGADVLTTQPGASVTATTASPAGEYPITVSGSAADNYAITYVNGTLSVTATTEPEPSFIRIVAITRAPFAFSFDAKEGRVYAVESSEDLRSWGTLKSYNGTGTLIRFEDERDQVFPQIYYRIRVVE